MGVAPVLDTNVPIGNLVSTVVAKIKLKTVFLRKLFEALLIIESFWKVIALHNADVTVYDESSQRDPPEPSKLN